MILSSPNLHDILSNLAGRRLLNYDARPFVPAGGPALASVTETGLRETRSVFNQLSPVISRVHATL